MSEESGEKASISEKEKQILKFWKENNIFEKTLKKPSPKGNFVFFEGPPTANGRPGIHHLEARAFKDLIPRFKTMQGYFVRRKGGWDTHGLPVEIQVEKELGLKSKKEIEEYGIAKFNEKCKESVWKYVEEWKEFTERIGYWIDLHNPYITYKPYYIESLWNIVKEIDNQKLLYKDYKVLPWCPRCQTALSSHELAQGYKDVKDLSVTAKFKVLGEENTYILAWTTTPWTLPGNVALAVGEKIIYCKVKDSNGSYILAKDRLNTAFKDKSYEIIEEFNGKDLIGLEYEPLFPFLKDNLPESEKEKLENAFKVYSADFVTTEDGTGIVHTAVMYGQDDFLLGTKVNLPKHHLVNEDGTFKEETGFLSGKFVKSEETDVEIIKDLAKRNSLFAKEKYEHSYPHCWRCKTALIYFARNSWYVRMSEVKNKLIKENQKINWEPNYIKDGRFGEWLNDLKDWAISRERFWGTPLPVWECNLCERKEIVGSFEELLLKSENKNLTRLILLRHGESEKNSPEEIYDSSETGYGLTRLGKQKAKEAARVLKNLDVSAVYSSPVRRSKETAEMLVSKRKIIFDDRLWEVRSGNWDGKKVGDPSILSQRVAYNNLPIEEYYKAKRGERGESWQQVEERMADFVREIISKHKGETVLIVSHNGPLVYLLRHLKELSLEEVTYLWEKRPNEELLGGYADPFSVFVNCQTGKEIDPHRPFIDDLNLACECGGEMKRVKEVMDVWFDSGAMPFAQDHYPFRNKNLVEENFPADFISEAIDQTRGWFYTLHAIGTLMKKGMAYKNVICLGHLLDREGKKMSKSLGNIVVPGEVIKKYGADALRFWMYTVNQPGESKNFDEKTVDEIVKKVINPLVNVLSFYKIFDGGNFEIQRELPKTKNDLDKWILSYLFKLTDEITSNLESYKVLEAARSIRDFITDLSQWYVRRSRDRFKEEEGEAKETLGFVLLQTSRILAPFMPFLAEGIYGELKIKDKKESVHLDDWPKSEKVDNKILENMNEVRRIVSLALEERSKAGIRVRQPIGEIKVKSEKLKGEEGLIALILDEVNVKKITFDKNIEDEVEIDTQITPKLKLEGDKRELIRSIQQLRKEKGFDPNQLVTLKIETDEGGRTFFERVSSEVKSITRIKDASFSESLSGEEFKIGESVFKFEVI